MLDHSGFPTRSSPFSFFLSGRLLVEAPPLWERHPPAHANQRTSADAQRVSGGRTPRSHPQVGQPGDGQSVLVLVFLFFSARVVSRGPTAADGRSKPPPPPRPFTLASRPRLTLLSSPSSAIGTQGTQLTGPRREDKPHPRVSLAHQQQKRKKTPNKK